MRFAKLMLVAVIAAAQSPKTYELFHAETSGPSPTSPGAGFLLAGGGATPPEAYRWFARKSGGGDAVTLRASGADAMNRVLLEAGGPASATTVLFHDRAASYDPGVIERIRTASALFLAGGDQFKYVSYWKGTPVAAAINDLVRRGVPVGGSSAGLAVLGEFSFSAEHDTVTSKAALADPFDPGVTIESNFIQIPLLKGVITDTHFVKRDRMGRTLVFLARILRDRRAPVASAIAVDEGNAVLLEPDGSATVSGEGFAYFLRTSSSPEVCEAGKPLTIRGIEVYRIGKAGRFDVRTWRGQGGTAYILSVDAGKPQSTQPGGSIY